MFNLARYGKQFVYSCPSTAITKEKTNSHHLKCSMPSARETQGPLRMRNNRPLFLLVCQLKRGHVSAEEKLWIIYDCVSFFAVPTAIYFHCIVGLFSFILNA